jgi:hypothetical protein
VQNIVDEMFAMTDAYIELATAPSRPGFCKLLQKSEKTCNGLQNVSTE